MKGKISIGDFIHQVKKELVEAQDTSGEPFYELHDVELEITFALEAKGKAGMNLYVVELGGEATASQTHKVTLKMKPIKGTPAENETGSKTTGRGGGGPRYGGGRLPNYAPNK
jgi:hypothetical protein